MVCPEIVWKWNLSYFFPQFSTCPVSTSSSLKTRTINTTVMSIIWETFSKWIEYVKLHIQFCKHSCNVGMCWVYLRFSSDPESVMKRTNETTFYFLGRIKDVFFNCYTNDFLTNDICLLINFILQKYECFLMGSI